jgi:hypothetical protein
MSSFMEHIHRDIGARLLFDDTAEWPPWSTAEPGRTTEGPESSVQDGETE